MESTSPKITTRFLLHHICKQRNIDSVLDLCATYNLDQVIVAGRRKTDRAAEEQQQQQKRDEDEEPEQQQNNQTSSSPPHVEYFRFFRDAIDTLKRRATRRHLLVGIEIDNAAVPAHALRNTIQTLPEFADVTDVTFIAGNEGEGLLQNERDVCDLFVFVPQFFRCGSGGSGGGVGSLNVATSVAVVLNEWCRPTASLPSLPSVISSSSNAAVVLVPVVTLPSAVPDRDEGKTESATGDVQSLAVHYLMRPATAFGATKLGVVSRSHRVFFGNNRSDFGRKMQSEEHCLGESFSSVFQAVRELSKEFAESCADRVFVLGVELLAPSNNNVAAAAQANNDIRSAPLLMNNGAALSATSSDSTLVLVVFGREQLVSSNQSNDDQDDTQRDTRREFRLSENDRKHCNSILTLPVAPANAIPGANDVVSGGTMNLPCLLSVVMHTLCLRFGFTPGGVAGESAKFQTASRSQRNRAMQAEQQARVVAARAAQKDQEIDADAVGDMFA